MGRFTLNDHNATTLFDSGVDYSFVSTTFIPLLGIEPSDLGFSYEIKIASGQLVVIDNVIRGCKLEIEGHVFDINLIPFGSWGFDVIIGMDWLSNHKAETICHEKKRDITEKGHTRSWKEMRTRSPDRLLGFPSGFPLGMVPPKNLDERNSLLRRITLYGSNRVDMK
nr:putative reverse transcriptase domain-containing protein [Tanacetum cinerariifolium]